MWIFHHQNYLVTRLLNEPWNCLHFQKDSWNVSWEIIQSIYRKGSNSCSWFWIIYQLWPQNIYRYCINKCSIITHHSKQSGSTHWWLDGEGPGNECVAYLTSMQWTCDFILWIQSDFLIQSCHQYLQKGEKYVCQIVKWRNLFSTAELSKETIIFSNSHKITSSWL